MHASSRTLLLLAQSLLCREVAQVQLLNIGTVRETWQPWLKEGMACLSDKPRSGARRKLDEAAIELMVQWAGALERDRVSAAPHRGARRAGPCRNAHSVLKEQGLVWKRARHSLKKTRRHRLRVQPARSPGAEATSGQGGWRGLHDEQCIDTQGPSRSVKGQRSE